MKYDIRNIEALANQLSFEDRCRMNEKVIRRVNDEYDRFLKAFVKNECYLCGTPLAEMNPRELCPH